MSLIFNILRLILLPLSVVYYVIITVRNFLYNKNILKTADFSIPIISAGNITAGGTGKTPLVIFLCEHFISKGLKVGVISRGYKSGTGILTISHDGTGVKAGVNKTGDEHAMIVNKFSEVKGKFFGIAHKNRLDAIKIMQEKFAPDVIILDDAFQNRKIRKKEIVLINSENKSFSDKILLPAGNLRETGSAFKRADLILNNFKFRSENITDDYSMHYTNAGFYNGSGDKLTETNRKSVVISGIADNGSFFNAVKNSGFEAVNSFAYADHYNYSANDIKLYESAFAEGMIFLTTEKDFVKLKELGEFTNKFPVYYLKIDVNLSDLAVNKISDMVLAKERY